MTTRFRVLGALEASRDGEALALGGPTQQAVLAVLLSHANRDVSADLLVEVVWGDRAGSRPLHTLRVHISEIRKVLEPDHQRGDDWAILTTTGDGYRLETRPADLDSARSEQLLEEAKEAAKDAPEAAYALLHEANDLWRGRPFGELETTSLLGTERSRLVQHRLVVLQRLFEVGLDLGKHRELVGPIQEASDEHPFDETLRGQLMLALYRSGRQADALEAYRAFAKQLGEELGLEPGQDLMRLEELVLTKTLGSILRQRRRARTSPRSRRASSAGLKRPQRPPRCSKPLGSSR